MAAARAEALWLEGRNDEVADATETALRLALRRQVPWVTGEQAYWRWRAGVREDLPVAAAAAPYRLPITGDWRRAADLWSELGCPCEAALALGDADGEDMLRSALNQQQVLGPARRQRSSQGASESAARAGSRGDRDQRPGRTPAATSARAARPARRRCGSGPATPQRPEAQTRGRENDDASAPPSLIMSSAVHRPNRKSQRAITIGPA